MKKGRYEATPGGIKYYPPDYIEERFQPPPDPNKDIRESKCYDDMLGEVEHNEQYNGFTVQLRFYCECDYIEDSECGLKFFIISSNGKTYTNGYLYYGGDENALNAAYEAIDNGEVPEDDDIPETDNN